MWGTGGKLRELKINLNQWEPSCMNHSLGCYMVMTANLPDVTFSLDYVEHWFSSPHAEQMM